MNVMCIYHAGCLDGFGAAYAVWRQFGGAAEYVPGQYKQPPPDCRGKTVFIVDFSYPRQVLEAIVAEAASVTILDHHDTAEQELKPLLESGAVAGVFDMERSGARLAWEWLHLKPLPPLLAHIEDRDLWRWELDGTREICDALYSLPMDFRKWDWVVKEGSKGLRQLRAEGHPIGRAHRNQVEKLKLCAQRTMIGGYLVPLVNAPHWYASDVAGELAAGEPFAGVYWFEPGQVCFSLRSREDGLHVGELASARYGGGGHPRAAGFTLDSMEQL